MRQDDLYLLDTNVLSELSRKRPHPLVIQWIDSVPDHCIAIPFSAVIEIERGIASLQNRDASKANELRTWLLSLLHSDLHFLPMDETVARIYGAMTAVPALRDLWVPDPNAIVPKSRQDLAIAATALAARAVIVSRNVRDFLRIHVIFKLPGLFDPMSGRWIIPRQEGIHEAEHTKQIAFDVVLAARRPSIFVPSKENQTGAVLPPKQSTPSPCR